MDNRQHAANLLAAAADHLQADGRLPRGSMQRIVNTLENNVIGTSRSGRTKYRRGTVANALRQLSDALIA